MAGAADDHARRVAQEGRDFIRFGRTAVRHQHALPGAHQRGHILAHAVQVHAARPAHFHYDHVSSKKKSDFRY